jgi:5-methylphenazine-1-carboxylate 1-monooxygenase
MTARPVLIAGGGIGGLATALTLHQIGVPCIVYEAAREMRPLGVGINMQPNAVRELYDLGITEGDLDRVGLPAREWALVSLNGNDIYSEPRGLGAGYQWPQYAVHRGQFHMLLHDEVVRRLGPQAIRLGCRVTGYRNNKDGSVGARIEHADGSTSEQEGSLLIGADGIHSAIRAQMHPTQPPIHWGGAIMWRGTTWGKPIRSGSSFVGLGTHRQASSSIRFRIPIRKPASRSSTGSPRSRRTMRKAGSRAAGSGRCRCPTSRIISRIGSGTGSMCPH